MDYNYLASICNSIGTILAVFAITAFGLTAITGDFDTKSLNFQIAKTLLIFSGIFLLWYLQFTYSIKTQLFAELNWIAGAISIGLSGWSVWGFIQAK